MKKIIVFLFCVLFSSVLLAQQGRFVDNGDGTVFDNKTSLVWSKAVDRTKLSLAQAKQKASVMVLGAYSDWRVPSIKELYTLMDFKGSTGFSGRNMYSVPSDAIPYIDTDYFDFAYGKTEEGERYIDAQWLSSTRYVSTTMGGAETLFGVNFADGRIKGYPDGPTGRGREKKFYVRYVRGPKYGVNDFVDNNDGTITDRSSGLIWSKEDFGPMNWYEAIKYVKSSKFAGYSDWRLPSAKELQYIVDYSRSPDTTNSAAVSPIFKTTAIRNEAGQKDYPYFWASTTHNDGPEPGANAVYVAFGRALGKMHGRVMDVHGAGAQRSDPKNGNATFRGPQGDVIRSNNYIRLVRGGSDIEPVKVDAITAASKPARKTKQKRSRRPSFVSRLDKNGDNKVSRQEFDGPPQAFNKHDQNKDGYLTQNEAPRPPPR